MKVIVKLYGTLRRFSLPETPGQWKGEIGRGSTLGELLNLIGISEREIACGAINGLVVPLDTVIQQDSEIVFVTPVGAG